MARRGGRRPNRPTASSREPSPEEQAAATEADQIRRTSMDKLEQFEVADLSGNSGRRQSAGAGVDMKQLDDAEMYDQTQTQSLPPSAADSSSSKRRKRRKPKRSQSGSEGAASATAAYEYDARNAASDSALQLLGRLNEGLDDAVVAEGRGSAVAALDNNETMLEQIMSSQSGSEDDGHVSPQHSAGTQSTADSTPRPDRRRHSFDGVTAIANDLLGGEENYDFDDCDLYGEGGDGEGGDGDGDGTENNQDRDIVREKQRKIASSAAEEQRRASFMESVVLDADSAAGKKKPSRKLEKSRLTTSMQSISMEVDGGQGSMSTMGSVVSASSNKKGSKTTADRTAAGITNTSDRAPQTRAYMDSVYKTNNQVEDDLEAQMKMHLSVSAIPSTDVMPKRSLTQRVKNMFSGKLRRPMTPIVPQTESRSVTPQHGSETIGANSKRRGSLYTEEEENALSEYINDAASVAAALELEGTISSRISETVQRGSPAFTVPLTMVVALAILLLALPLVYVPPALTPASPPAWVPVLTIGIPITEYAAQILIVVASLAVASAAGSDVALYFVRHCSFYLALVCSAYLSADIAYVNQIGEGESERIFRMVVTGLLGLASSHTLYTLERTICRKVQQLAYANAMEAHSDAEIEQYFGNRDQEAEEKHLQRRVRAKISFHHVVSGAIKGLQGLAVLMIARAVAGYLIQDLGMAEDITFVRRSLQEAGEAETLLDVEMNAQGGKMFLSLIESIGVFMHSAFVLSLFSAALLSPHNLGLVGVSAFAALGRLVLCAGYIANLFWSGVPMMSADFLWSFGLIAIEAICCALVLIATCSWTPLVGDIFKKRAEEGTDASSSLQETERAPHSKTLHSIAFPARNESQPNIWTKTLYLSSLGALTIYTIQGVLLLDYHTSLYKNHFIIDVVVYGMIICFVYAFINYVSVARNGEFYRLARLAIALIGFGGAALSVWQVLGVVIGCAYQGMTRTDSLVMALLGAGICSNALMFVSALALKDINAEAITPISASSSATNLSASVMANKAAEVAKNAPPPPPRSVENKLRKRALISLCLYVPAVLVYSLVLAIFDGHDDLVEAPLPLSTIEEGEEGSGALSSSSLPSEAEFSFVAHLPGLHVLFHFGLIFVLFCADGIRKRPSMSVSLSTASLLSSHAFGMLVLFFVLVFDFGQISILGRSVGELVEAGTMILWFCLLIPLSLSLHHLCEYRSKQTHHRSRSLSLVGSVTVNPAAPFHGAAMQRPGGGHFELDLL